MLGFSSVGKVMMASALNVFILITSEWINKCDIGFNPCKRKNEFGARCGRSIKKIQKRRL